MTGTPPPSGTSTDRTVHGHTFDGGEIVRYDRAGKWYIEWPDGRLVSRRAVSASQAAAEAMWNGDRALLGRPGGGRFDHIIMRIRADRGTA